MNHVPPDIRIVAQFSCGAASAVATKIAIDRWGDRVCVINAFVADEDDDNRRFLRDCEQWFGREITVLRDEKYGASAIEVWRRRRFIVNRNGAPCSKTLKRDLLNAWRDPSDAIVLGYTADLRDAARLDRYIDAHASEIVIAPLVEAEITKLDCLRIVREAGIEIPRMYRLGYPNANCPGCPKGGEGYWNRIRVDFPERFEAVARVQDMLGEGAYFFRNRKTGQRISLRMLDPSAGRFTPIESFECGATCEMPDGREIS